MDCLEMALIQDFFQRDDIVIDKILASKLLSQVDLATHLKEINHTLHSKLTVEEQQIYLSEKDREKCYRYLKKKKVTIFTYYEGKYRRALLLLHLLLSKEDMNLAELTDQLLVSKNTALAEIKRLKQELESKGIFLKYSRKTGYALLGSEFIIRNELVNTLKSLLKQPSGKYFLLETGFIKEHELLLLKNRLTNLQQRAQLTFTEESLEELPIVLAFLVKRAQHHKGAWHFKVEKYDIKNTKEFPMYAELFRHAADLNENDLLYLVLQVLSATIVKTKLDLSDSEDIVKATDRFIAFLEEECVMQFANREKLKEKLLLHVRPAIYRCLLCVNIKNPLTDVFIEEYRPLYEKINVGVGIFEELIGRAFPKEEVVFIAMIVISSMIHTRKAEKNQVFRAMVLCRSGMSISKLLLENLRSMFPKIEFVGAYAIHEVSETGFEPDFIFTTIPIHTEITTFLVPPVLDKEARAKIKNQVEVAINEDVTKKTKELFSYLSDLFPEFCKDDAFMRIESFYMKDEQPKIAVEEDHFLLTMEHITMVQSADMDEALTEAFQPLLDRGSITETYVEACRTVFHQDYPYMMIAYECYLPHVKPEYGVLNPDYQILFIQEKTELPNKESMRMMIALAPSIENQHVEWLLKMNQVLLESELPQKMTTITSEKELFLLIQEELNKIAN
ncbi:BglG family transcription antiterminator [uncultured Enterococcus sp.]|uniref:BglG family transcription antiterminator n=1 Tax=uncultured Enterococcus sp. TaxID=167972 RepID=UPI002AA75D21|nr:BglG family transcription antiterminator [uncultured Enterococcus sp.]